MAKSYKAKLRPRLRSWIENKEAQAPGLTESVIHSVKLLESNHVGLPWKDDTIGRSWFEYKPNLPVGAQHNFCYFMLKMRSVIMLN
jgi:hypothetical protein